MKGKLESDEFQRLTDLENDNVSRNWANGQYGEKKIRKKRPLLGNRILHDQGKISTYSSSSRLTSMLKGQSYSQAENFKVSQSTYFNQLTEKYVPRGSPPQKIRQQMELTLERKKSEIQALRVHRDQLKFISYNNPYDMPIKMSLAVLKEKARAQQKIKDMMMTLQKDIKEIQFEFNTMTDYYNFVSNALKSSGEDDLIIDTQQEQRLMIQNLEKETNHLFRELKQEDKKNAKEIRNMQQEIGSLRVFIKQKQDKIRDLKSMICTLHIKLHSRGATSKEKSISLSTRKFITEKNSSIQQAFIGNSSFKHYSKQILEKINEKQQLLKIVFFFESKKECLTFKCFYKTEEGKLHSLNDQNVINNNPIASPTKMKKQVRATQIKIKYLLSIKFYFKSKIVGVQCRIKSEKGAEHIQIGNCTPNLEHELLTLVNKKIITMGSYWHQKDMIGVGVWYCGKGGASRNTSTDSKELNKNTLKNVKSTESLAKQKGMYISQYYEN